MVSFNNSIWAVSKKLSYPHDSSCDIHHITDGLTIVGFINFSREWCSIDRELSLDFRYQCVHFWGQQVWDGQCVIQLRVILILNFCWNCIGKVGKSLLTSKSYADMKSCAIIIISHIGCIKYRESSVLPLICDASMRLTTLIWFTPITAELWAWR